MQQVATIPNMIAFDRGRGGIFIQAVQSGFALVGALPLL
jgi:hypothetical protein